MSSMRWLKLGRGNMSRIHAGTDDYKDVMVAQW